MFILAAVALAGCSHAPTVTVVNGTSTTLSNVVVVGTGFSNRIDSIAPGAEHTLNLHPSGESGLRLSFDAGRQHIDAGDQGYFEPGGHYRVKAIVHSNLSVSVTSEVRSY